jgi:glycosyltransferase involved in cell wall biosynthesis
MIPDEKILLSGNGIDPADFEAMDGKVKRDPYRVFYGSSHTRGLQYLYDIWPQVKKAVPQATLDVYYGRYSYDKINRGNPERIKWMDNMMATASRLEGVTDHGKVGQDELVKIMMGSGVWGYPCPFPEIFAITAVKVQAAGCIPVSTDFAALNETVQFGTKIHIPNDGLVGRADDKFLKEYTELLIKTLKESPKFDRAPMMRWARTLSWQKIAEQWSMEFSDED